MSYRHLLAPGRIGSMPLRNRIFMTPMGSNLADEDGITGDRLRAYYEARAKGGAALITMGSVSIGYPEGSGNWRNEAISDERHVPGVKALADAVHAHGAKLAMQLQHAGLVAMNDMLAGRPIWTPSIPAVGKSDGDMMDGFLEDELAIFTAPFAAMGEPNFKVMTAQDIEHLVQMFASAAERAKRAGVDAVEIHAGHGYLISSFLNPLINQRSDDYGGPIGLPLALSRPSVVRRLVALNTWMWSFDDDPDMVRKGRIAGGRVGRLLYRYANFSLRVLTPSAYADRKKLTPRIHRQYLEPFRELDSRERVLWPLARAILESSAYYDSLWRQRENLRDLPALVIWGTKDSAFRPHLLDRWRQVLPTATVVELPVGHWPQEEAPDLVIRSIESFLRLTS